MSPTGQKETNEAYAGMIDFGTIRDQRIGCAKRIAALNPHQWDEPWVLRLGSMMAKRQPRGRFSQSGHESSLVHIAAQSSDLGRHGRIFNDGDVIALLRAAVEHEGNQVAFARRHGLDRAHLNMILNGKRPVSEKIIKALGFRKVYTVSE